MHLSGHSIALAELLANVEDARTDESVAPIFKLVYLVKLYTVGFEQLGVKQQNCLYSTRLKDRILSHIPDLSAHREGCDVHLAFAGDVSSVMRKACDSNYDDIICPARATKIVRRDMLKLQSTFTGTFTKDCQVKSVPSSLLALISMIQRS